MMIGFKQVCRLGLVATLAAAAGCSSLGGGAQLPQDAVRERAQAWLDAVMAEKFAAAWEYTSPNYRQFSSAEDYVSVVQGSARWTSATVDSVTCTEDVCDVGIMVEYKIAKLNVQNRRSLPYKWVLIDKEWWLYVPPRRTK